MAITDRSDVQPLIQEGFSETFLTDAPKASAVLSAFPVINLGSSVTQLPMIESDSKAQFIGETSNADLEDGLKPSTKITWGNKTMYVAEVAQVQTVPDAVLADASGDVVRQIVVNGTNAIAKAMDAAVIKGEGKPGNWTSNALVPAALASGQVLSIGADALDIVDALYQANELLLDQGFENPVLIGRQSLRGVLANARGTDGHLIGGQAVIDDFAPTWTNALGADYAAIVVDASSVGIGVRSDVQASTSQEATVDGVSMFQNDSTAFRFFARYGFVLKSDNAVVAIRKTPEGS